MSKLIFFDGKEDEIPNRIPTVDKTTIKFQMETHFYFRNGIIRKKN